MTSQEAIKLDKDSFYVLIMSPTTWGVIGAPSGYCYSLWDSRRGAEQAATEKGKL